MANPNYYALIPASIRYDKDLSPSEKLFFAEITALTNMNGKCFASNSYFASLYGVANSTISLWVGNLAKRGHIDVDYIYDGKQITKRYISITNPMGLHQFTAEIGSQESDGVVRKSEGGSQKIGGGYSENPKDNNTLTESNTTFTKSNTKTRSVYSDDFEKAWELYERKGSKKDAYKQWMKVSDDDKLKIVEAIPKYVLSAEYQYRKDFERYISSGRYEGSEIKDIQNKQAWKDFKPLEGSTLDVYRNYGNKIG